MAEVFPPSWYKVEARELVLDFLRELTVPAEDRKYAMQEWAKRAGVEVTAEMVEYVTKLKAGEV